MVAIGRGCTCCVNRPGCMMHGDVADPPHYAVVRHVSKSEMPSWSRNSECARSQSQSRIVLKFEGPDERVEGVP